MRNLRLVPYANQTFLTSGMDSPEEQLRRSGSTDWFDNYPHEVVYNFNSRGFRDAEWPESIDDLKQSIWCVGDSFTVGLGANYKHTWPYILQEKTQRRTINVSMDGASNARIAINASYILYDLQPEHMVIHWSYTHRREQNSTADQSDPLKLRLMHDNTTAEEDANDIIERIRYVEVRKHSTNIIHSFIPNFHNDTVALEDRIVDTFPDAKIITRFQQLDLARDLHHYGKVTAEKFVDTIMKLL